MNLYSTQWSKYHPPVLKCRETHPCFDIHQSLSVNSLFWKAWCIIHQRASRSEGSHLSPSPQLRSWVSHWVRRVQRNPHIAVVEPTGLKKSFFFYLNANRGQFTCLLLRPSCLHRPTYPLRNWQISIMDVMQKAQHICIHKQIMPPT